MTDRLAFAQALGREAGVMAHRGFGRSAATLKGRHDILTAMDAEVERFIRRSIAERFPGDAVIGEEEGGADGERLWIIDPIDGTANYARGIPHYCVSIGYLEHGVPTLGVIHDPSHDALYAAALGRGAWRNDERLAVSPCDDLGAATVECGWSTRRPARPTSISWGGCWPPAGRSGGQAPARSGSSTSPPAASRATPSCTSMPGTARQASSSSARRVAVPTTSSRATAFAPATR